MPSKAELEEIVQTTFEYYKDGIVPRKDFKQLLKESSAGLGVPAITDAQLDEVIKTVDDNGDGKFSFDELFKIIGPILEQQLA